ncbi:hypothetical protein [Streptomyces sp. NBC_00162]|uniref:hypothetical protein n=1 Tax=Streptomyces sp. NBC_00162 TaxID=2903629 RepID=UPI00214C34FD|nr:hypothetical protein [Streptomyces sp. NBC_00162]UUU37588.1 hypothetical protein JIW86_00770 [Streptomyces sp. NBC_00162]
MAESQCFGAGLGWLGCFCAAAWLASLRRCSSGLWADEALRGELRARARREVGDESAVVEAVAAAA